jgi:hypothetical protein
MRVPRVIFFLVSQMNSAMAEGRLQGRAVSSRTTGAMVGRGVSNGMPGSHAGEGSSRGGAPFWRGPSAAVRAARREELLGRRGGLRRGGLRQNPHPRLEACRGEGTMAR